MHIAFMSAVPSVSVSVDDKGFAAVNAGLFIYRRFLFLHGLRMSQPPFPPAFLRTKLSLSPHRRLLNKFPAAQAGAALLNFLFDVHRHNRRIAFKAVALAVVANHIPGKVENGSNGLVAESFDAIFPKLFFLKISHCFTSFRRNLHGKRPQNPAFEQEFYSLIRNNPAKASANKKRELV